LETGNPTAGHDVKQPKLRPFDLAERTHLVLAISTSQQRAHNRSGQSSSHFRASGETPRSRFPKQPNRHNPVKSGRGKGRAAKAVSGVFRPADRLARVAARPLSPLTCKDADWRFLPEPAAHPGCGQPNAPWGVAAIARNLLILRTLHRRAISMKSNFEQSFAFLTWAGLSTVRSPERNQPFRPSLARRNCMEARAQFDRRRNRSSRASATIAKTATE